MKRVEPPSRLIDPLRNIIRRIVLRLFAFTHEVILREWHRTRIEPHVDHFGCSMHGAAARAIECDLIHIRLVWIELLVCWIDSRSMCLTLRKIRESTDRALVPAFLAYPDGKRRAPEPLTRYAPIF